MEIRKSCLIKDCDGYPIGRGYCSKHYMRLKRNGDPEKINPRMHGMTGSAIYEIWQNIKNNHTIIPEWQVFINFFNDVGDKPTWGHFLKKLDQDKPYGPDNFKWHITEKNRKWNEERGII